MCSVYSKQNAIISWNIDEVVHANVQSLFLIHSHDQWTIAN